MALKYFKSEIYLVHVKRCKKAAVKFRFVHIHYLCSFQFYESWILLHYDFPLKDLIGIINRWTDMNVFEFYL